MATSTGIAALPLEPAVRDKLYAAAARLFARKGYAAATVREIVEEAGVTKPVLYYYFGNKEGIYRSVLETALRDFEQRMDAVEKLNGSASFRLRRMCDEVFAVLDRHADLVRLMHAIVYGPPHAAPSFDFDRPLTRLHDGVREIIRQGLRSGEFRGSAEAMTLAALGALNECVDLALVRPEMAVDRAGFGKVLNVVLHGMKRKKR